MSDEDNVVKFPGGTFLDIDCDKVLEGAMGRLGTVLVVGLTTDNELYLAASSGDLFKNHFLATLAAQDLLDMA